MGRMGIDNGLAQQFMAQQQYSPRAKYILLTALDAMSGTAGRAALIQVALEAPNEEWALFYQQMGYEVISVVEDFPRRPHSEYHLRKTLR